MDIQFKVVSWCNNELSYIDKKSDFILERDSWNDKNFFTLYHLHIGTNIIDKGAYLGYIKILKKGQKENERNLVPESFCELGNEFCSFCSSLDLYEKINRYLPKEKRIELMVALRNIVYDQSILNEFEGEQGIVKSFFRSSSLQDDIFKLAPVYILDDSHLLTNINETLTIKLSNIKNELILNFGSDYSDKYEDIPNRVNVLIGRNGCGKSTVLYKLCKLLYASSDQRSLYEDKIGAILPQGVGFTKIICISYSPFDSFQMPGFSCSDKKMLCEGIENGEGRFIYCGIRDIAKEVRQNLDNYQKQDQDDVCKYFEDRHDITLLKDISELGEEFANLYFKIIENKDKLELLNDSFNILKLETSLCEFLDEIDEFKTSSKVDIVNFFNRLSTGHKFTIHSVFSIIYHIKSLSIVLFDEPENHLHPPLLAILMKTIRMILKKNMSVMIIGTHSPVVLQETLHCNINVIRREGRIVSISNPALQTFGENTGLITSQIFDLTSNITDYHDVLDSLLRQVFNKTFSYDTAIEELEKCLGGQLSNQSYFYITNRINSKNNL